MAALTDVYLTNKDNLNNFLFRGVHGFAWKRTQPSISIPFINAGAANNVLFRFMGQTDIVSFRFALFNDGTDVSGSDAAGIITIKQQIAYLRDNIFTEDYDVDVTLEDTNNEFTPSGGFDGVLEHVEVDAEKGGVNVRFGTLEFKRGRIGSL